MKKLLLLLWIIPYFAFSQGGGKTIAFQKNMKIFNGQESSYFLNTSSTSQSKSGQLTLSDSLLISILATSDVKVLSPTSTGGTTSLETADVADITQDTILVDFINVTNNIDVGDTLQVNGTIDGFQSDGTTSLYYHEHNNGYGYR